MAILLFVLLAWSLAVHGLFSMLPPRIWTVQMERQSDVPENPKPWLESHGLRRRQEAQSNAFTPCGDEQNRCSRLGHPEICCPPSATCRHSSYTPSHILCCPSGWSCGPLASAQCPRHTFPCPSSIGGGCCPVGLRCGSELCLEYLYKTLAVYRPLQIPGIPTIAPLNGRNRAISTIIAGAQDVILPSGPSTVVTATSCTSPNCKPGASEESHLNLPISDRILGTPTAWRAKIGEIAVTSEADEGADSKTSQKRLIRLICITAGMAVITAFMMIL